MKFFVKLKYLKPVEGTDKIKRTTDTYVVDALSVAEAEGRLLGWIPANFQDPRIDGVNSCPIVDVNRHGESEDWWVSSMAFESLDGRASAFQVAVNGISIREAVSALENMYATANILSISKTNKIFDAELLSPPEPAREVPAQSEA